VNRDYSFHPELVDDNAFIAPGAVVVGNVSVRSGASIWYNAVVRGDAEQIVVGCDSNVQDLAMLHADPGFPCLVGEGVTIGHGAVVHGAVVEDGVMIGMRAVVMNGAKIGAGSIIGAGCVVTEGVEVPPNRLVLGVPGKVRRELRDADRDRIEHASAHYVSASKEARRQLRGD
jgi:carbonic anhydrase/acetyltransferase-like protein (isoleucine patch superfamily)